MIRRWVKLDDGRLLDAGCGLGTYLQAMEEYSHQRFGLEIEYDRARSALNLANGVVQGIGESLPFSDHVFDFVLSNEVIEHVEDDRLAVREMVRITRPGGRIVIFCPNRWYPVEQHGIYWRGRYRYGNIPLVNYLPIAARNRLAPHVRTYTRGDLMKLLNGLGVKIVHHGRIFGGYDNIENRWPLIGRTLKRILYAAEGTPASVFGISHFLVLEKQLAAN
jgi:SAM-dependent methyltransferase